MPNCWDKKNLEMWFRLKFSYITQVALHDDTYIHLCTVCGILLMWTFKLCSQESHWKLISVKIYRYEISVLLIGYHIATIIFLTVLERRGEVFNTWISICQKIFIMVFLVNYYYKTNYTIAPLQKQTKLGNYIERLSLLIEIKSIS